MNWAIETEGLTKRFGEVTAVDGLTIDVAEGEILALLGPNGAGKTTTVRLLSSILRPDTGRAIVAGHDVLAQPQMVRQKVGLLTEFPGLYQRMPALDYLIFFGELYRLSPQRARDRSLELLQNMGLEDFAQKRLGGFSKGMRQKMALLRALVHDPPILFLDEPTSAMDPESAKMVRETILGLRSTKRTIFLCTHNLPEAESLADRIAIIHHGRILALGSTTELKRSLLGPPLIELRLAHPWDGFRTLMQAMVEIEAGDSNWIRYRTDSPESINPLLIKQLTQRGAEVIHLGEVPQSLEEVYLRIIRDG